MADEELVEQLVRFYERQTGGEVSDISIDITVSDGEEDTDGSDTGSDLQDFIDDSDDPSCLYESDSDWTPSSDSESDTDYDSDEVVSESDDDDVIHVSIPCRNGRLRITY